MGSNGAFAPQLLVNLVGPPLSRSQSDSADCLMALLPLRFLFFFIYNCIYLFILSCVGSSLLHRLLFTCGEQGLLSSCTAWASPGSGFSCGACVPGHSGFSSSGTRARQLRMAPGL